MYELAVAQPVWSDVARGLAPSKQLFTDPGMLYIAIGILGATVMPHNLYLHSAVIQTRAYDRAPAGRARAIRYGTLDSSVSLLFAFVINASILILAGAAFHYGPSAKRCVLVVFCVFFFVRVFWGGTFFRLLPDLNIK
jgi:manganese transport protein